MYDIYLFQLCPLFSTHLLLCMPCTISIVLCLQVWGLDGPDLANIAQDTVRNDSVRFMRNRRL